MSLLFKLKQRRRLAIIKHHNMNRILPYLTSDEIRKLSSALRKKKATLETKKLPISFLISGNNLIPQVNSEVREFQWYNILIENKHRDMLQREFSKRAFNILPNFIAPQCVGFVEEKLAALAALFSNLKIAYIGHGSEIVDSLKPFKANVSKLSKNKKVEQYYDFVFKPKPAKVGVDIEKVCNISGDLEFIKEYIKLAKKLKVNIPKSSYKLIDSFVKKQGRGRAFFNSTEELCKAFARVELRREVCNRDLARAFRVASKAVNS